MLMLVPRATWHWLLLHGLQNFSHVRLEHRHFAQERCVAQTVNCLCRWRMQQAFTKRGTLDTSATFAQQLTGSFCIAYTACCITCQTHRCKRSKRSKALHRLYICLGAAECTHAVACPWEECAVKTVSCHCISKPSCAQLRDDLSQKLSTVNWKVRHTWRSYHISYAWSPSLYENADRIAYKDM